MSTPTTEQLQALNELNISTIELLNDQITALRNELAAAHASTQAAQGDLAIAEKARDTFRDGFERQQQMHEALLTKLQKSNA